MAVVVLCVGLSGCGAPDDGAVPSLLNAGYDLETGRLQLIEFDSDENGTVDTWTRMDGSRVLQIEIDADEDGRIERWEYYDERRQPREGGLFQWQRWDCRFLDVRGR